MNKCKDCRWCYDSICTVGMTEFKVDLENSACENFEGQYILPSPNIEKRQREETATCLEILLRSAKPVGKMGTIIGHVTLESFKWVINRAINQLREEEKNDTIN